MSFAFKPTAHVLSMFVAACLLAACAGQMQQTSPTRALAPADAAQQAASQGDYARATELYSQAFEQATDPQSRRQLRFEAGITAAHAGRASAARNLLGGTDLKALSDLDRARYNLARTEVQTADLTPARALQQFPPPQSGTPPAVAARVWQKRAELHFAENDLIAGIRDLVQRGVWLVDEQAINSNDDTIYDKTLDAIAYGQGPESTAARQADDTTRGWLALAAIGQQRYSSRGERDQALASWEQQYPGHPATRNVLQTRFDYTPRTAPRSTRRQPGGMEPLRPTSDTVALALPLTGNFASAAEAIRDGFMFAYQNDRTAPSQPRIYDTNTMSAQDIVENARRDQIGILVGPLDKAKVSEMAQLQSGIPTVALNYTDTPVNQRGFYQFALAPEDEASAVAQHAQRQGYTRALALVPKGDWGNRVFDAFRDTFNQAGGQVIDYATYDPKTHDHRDPIQAVLRSYQQGGVDFIFVAAQPVQGRLIRSQLRFYHATRLPMLSTSHIYTGTPDPDSDIDLNSVGFADLPWIVGSSSFLDERRAAATQRYGDVAQRYARLFAMGMDAWELADRVGHEGLRTGDAFEGMTGVLAVQPDGSLKRYLAWAVFRNGQPQLVDMPSISDAQSDTLSPEPWAQTRSRP